MVRKIHQKFLLVSMGAFLIVVLLFIAAINLFHYAQNEKQSEYLLSILEENNGEYPEYMHLKEKKKSTDAYDVTVETKYQTRYFSATLSGDNQIVKINRENIAAVSENMITSYVAKILASSKKSGYQDNYKYVVKNFNGGKMIIFLDCNMTRLREKNVFLISIQIGVAGLILVFIVLCFLTKHAISPFIEVMHKQKQFITDAGHELKTPLAIISANAEVLEFSDGENEWTQSIRKQTKRLDELIKSMLTLARLEEMPATSVFTEIPISEIVQSEAEPFITLAQNKQKKLSLDITPNLSCKGDEKQFRQIVSIFLDNAVKYTDEDGEICLQLAMENNHLVIRSTNDYTGASANDLKKVFERFRRTDSSRARQTGGYGIGLSVAKAIVDFYKGKIAATVPKKDVVCFTAVFPKKM